jgi:hypothetical protein
MSKGEHEVLWSNSDGFVELPGGDFFGVVMQELGVKGSDYAYSGGRFSNFQWVAKLLKVPPRTVWAVYFLKHVFAVMKYCTGKDLESEGIEGRLVDVAAYAYLLWAGVREGEL